MDSLPATDSFLREHGDLFSNSDVSEHVKDEVAMAATILTMKEYNPPDTWVEKWKQCQTDILKPLMYLIPGAQLKFYNMEYDGLCGAYLQVDLPLYIITIDVEDIRSMEEYLDRKVVTVNAHHEPTLENPDEGEIFNNGFVETMEEAGYIVTCLKEGRFKDAMRLLFRLKFADGRKVERTLEDLEAVVRESEVRYTVSRHEP